MYVNKNVGYVLIERVTNRLSNLKMLTESQTLKVLYSVYRALDEVGDEWEEHWVKENSICFNGDGEVKIWKSS